MTSPPERPWAGGAWDTLTVVGPPRWHRALMRPLVALFALVLLVPFAATAWWMFLASEEREAIRSQFYDQALPGLTSGECVDEIGEGEQRSLKRVPCASPHDGEITGVVELTAGGYPGEDQIIEESEALCSSATERWVAEGPGADLDLDWRFFYPSSEGWAEGSPTTTCYAVVTSGKKISGPLGAVL